MAQSFTQVPPNSTGNKMRTRTRIQGADTVHEQAVFLTAQPTYYAMADNVAFAANKHHFAIFNQVGTDQFISIKKIFQINLQTAAVTGIAVRFDFKKATAVSGGTAITAQSVDSTNAALTGVTIATGATVTEGALLYPYVTNSDEVTAANTAVSNFLTQYGNLSLESPEMQEFRLRPGEGLTIKQITSSTVGSFAWLVAFTVESTL